MLVVIHKVIHVMVEFGDWVAAMIVKRSGNFHLRRRVPRRFQEIDTREAVYMSLHTASEEFAKVKAPMVWALLLEGWEAKEAGDEAFYERRFQEAQRLAAASTLRYAQIPSLTEIASQPAVSAPPPKAVPVQRSRPVGVVAKPKVVSELPERGRGDLGPEPERDTFSGLSRLASVATKLRSVKDVEADDESRVAGE